MPSLFGQLFGTKEKTQNVQNFTPQQRQIMDMITGAQGKKATGAGLENIMGLLSGSPEALEAFQAPARREFQEKTLPGIAEQFAGAGALRSSGFNRAATGAGAQLEENLSAQKAELQQNALQQLMQMLGIGLQSQYTPMIRPGTAGGLTSFLGSATGAMSGGLGAGVAGGLGSLFGSEDGTFRPGFQQGTQNYYGR